MGKAGVVAMLAAVVAWLVLSYWPAGAAVLPVIAFGPGAAAWLLPLMVAALALAVAIQAWLIYATVQPLRKAVDAAHAAVLRQFNLRVGVEALLTAAPLLITAALAILILQL